MRRLLGEYAESGDGERLDCFFSLGKTVLGGVARCETALQAQALRHGKQMPIRPLGGFGRELGA